jgi:UDP-N-acetylmuramoylalanine--D-glutamate ligase
MTQVWEGRRVLILGAARQGLALARYLAHCGAIVTVNDQRPAEQMSDASQAMKAIGVLCVWGGHPLDLLDEADLVCLSGGVPLTNSIVAEANRRGIPLSNDTQIFMEVVPASIIAITGSAGKTTTTTLVGRMAEAAVTGGQKAWVGGNIGLPLVDHLEEIKAKDLVVLEISSFQLEQMTLSPHIGAVLNITPNHLDRHGTLEAYTAAKARLIQFQKADDIAILNREDAGSWSLKPMVHGALSTFGAAKPQQGMVGSYLQDEMICLTDGQHTTQVMPKSAVQLRGEHNLMNVLAACAIAFAANWPVEAMQKAVAGFAGVAHRLEFVREWHAASWYNDSIATAPERTAAAIHSFSEPLVLLLGGRDKNLPWEDLAALIHERVDHVIVFGEAAEKILTALGPQQAGRRPFTLTHCEKLQQAVQAAAEVAEAGDVILLAPGGTSFDEFKDFEERGERFRKWVNQLK